MFSLTGCEQRGVSYCHAYVTMIMNKTKKIKKGRKLLMKDERERGKRAGFKASSPAATHGYGQSSEEDQPQQSATGTQSTRSVNKTVLLRTAPWRSALQRHLHYYL